MAELGAGNGTSIPTGIDTRQTYTNGPNPRPDSSSRIDAEMVNDILAFAIAMETDLYRTRFVDARTYSTFTEAVVASANKTLLICSSVTLDANTTIGASTSLLVLNPGIINANGKTLTINGPLVGNPMHQWLSGFTAGNIIYPQGPSRPEWFGLISGTSDGTANLLAFNCALAMSKTIITGDGDFYVSDVIVQPTDTTWIGNHKNTIIRVKTGASGGIRLGSTSILSGFAIRGDSGHTGFGLGISDNAILISNSVVRDIDIRGFDGVGGSGVKFGNSVSIHLENIYSGGNDINLLTRSDEGPTETSFVKCQFRQAIHKGTKILKAQEMTFNNCNFESNNEEGFYSENGTAYVTDIRFIACHSENNWASLSGSPATRHTKYTYNFIGTDNAGPNYMGRISFKDSLVDIDTSNMPLFAKFQNTHDIYLDGGNIENEAGQITADGSTSYGVYAHPSAITPGSTFVGITNTNGAYVNVEGRWISVPFSAGNFTANGSMTWTVESGDVVNYSYMVIGETMYLNFYIDTSTIGGTPNTQLRITLPNSYKGKLASIGLGYVLDNGTATSAYIAVSVDVSYIAITRVDGAAWAASTNNTSVRGQLTFAVKR